MRLSEARTKWAADAAMLRQLGIEAPDHVISYMTDEVKRDYRIAMDAQPGLITTPNTGVPAYLTQMIDPKVIDILFSPLKAADIIGEEKRGDWTTDTMIFQVVEATGEVSSYGDFNNNGVTGVNTNWPNRQSYLYQTHINYGEREMERAALARLDLVARLNASAVTVLNRFQNDSYFFGIAGLENYGLLTDPDLSAPITPAPKAWGGTSWFNSSGALVATPLEIYNDVISLFSRLVSQSGGILNAETRVVLAMSPASAIALTASNTFGINVTDLLKKNFPNIRFETAIQYGVRSAQNPRGPVGGNIMQMIAESVDGQDTGFAAFNVKLKAHAIVVGTSSWKQKMSQGTWGAVLTQPFAIASMIGI
jgi:hypothetical protein